MQSVLTKCLSGVDVPLVTVTAQGGAKHKQAVVLTARVHPGETVGSWMMRGALTFLTDPDSKEAQILRENFIFKVIPMLNPDGVTNGNYRCSLAGCDLNRRWKFPSKSIQPTIYYAKKLIKELHQERQVALVCDMHGHSRKQNIFMYGCDSKTDPAACRVLPYILSKLSPLFDFRESKFGVQASKDATARVALFKELKTCPQVFTIESTFSGIDIGALAGQHISTSMLESMGVDLLRGFLVQQNLHVPHELQAKKVKTFAEGGSNPEAYQLHQSYLQELRQIKATNSSDSGSDSEPSMDNLDPNTLATKLPVVDKALQQAIQKS